MANKNWTASIDESIVSDIKKKYLEICVYASENGLSEVSVRSFSETILSKETLDKIPMEDFFKK